MFSLTFTLKWFYLLRVSDHFTFLSDWGILSWHFWIFSLSFRFFKIVVHWWSIMLSNFNWTFIVTGGILNFLLLFISIQTTNLKMNLIIRLNRIGQFLWKRWLWKLSQIGGIMIFMAIEYMLKIYSLIRYI